MSIATDEAVQKYPAPTDESTEVMNEKIVEEYDDATSEDLAGVLVGRRIVNVDSDSGIVVLDDGTELEFEDTADCCAWYDVTVEPHMDYSDNVITRVVVLDDQAFKPSRADPEYDDVYTIRVLGRDKAILDVNVEGDPTSGYYCTSFELNVRRMPQTVKEK